MSFVPASCSRRCGFLLVVVLGLAASALSGAVEPALLAARANAERAHEGYARSLRLTRAWLAARDPRSGLIPSRLPGEAKTDRTDVWEPHNAAADNYAFMTLSAALLDPPTFAREMADMLRTERQLSSRLYSLPDSYSFTRRGFQYDEPDPARILFVTSEYMKDGLLPLTEYLGKTPWSDRLLEMLNDVPRLARMSRGLAMEQYRAVDAEINGNLLQTLSRCYWLTGEQRYLDWAMEIADHYLLGDGDLRRASYLRLRDHGCEIIAGLSEIYVAVSFANPAKQAAYRPALHGLLDAILEVGRNPHGLFFDAINLRDRTVTETRVADTWGYIFNAYYAVHLIDSRPDYLAAVTQALGSLNLHYRSYNWENGSQDGYADSIESALNLINRLHSPEVEEWIDREIRIMWAKQRPDGIVEGWWGDGNFSRTTIMYALWKTQGAHVSPWRDDLRLGAVPIEGGLFVVLSAAADWQGTLRFDRPRHRDFLHLPLDYPRINQFPEWFTVETGLVYAVTVDETEPARTFQGSELIAGIPLRLRAGQEARITVIRR